MNREFHQAPYLIKSESRRDKSRHSIHEVSFRLVVRVIESVETQGAFSVVKA